MNDENKIYTVFSKNSPIHTLSSCEDSSLSLLNRLQLFACGPVGISCLRFACDQKSIPLLERLLDVKSTSDKKLFNDDEVEYLKRMNLQLDIPRVYFLTEKNDKNVLEKFILLGYYEEIPKEYYTIETMNIAVELGKVKAMVFLHERKCPWDEWTPRSASENGQLGCLKYAHENGCPWDKWTPAYAAENGYLHCLEYAHTHGCPWERSTCAWAAGKGHLSCLKYAHENGCEWDRWTCQQAAENGQLECLKYAHENGCPWDEKTPAWAAEKGHLITLKYAHENGCEWNFLTYRFAEKSGNVECLEYVREHGCPQ